MNAFSDAASCSLIEIGHHFGGAYCLHHQGGDDETVSTSEMFVSFCETTKCSIPEGSHLHTHTAMRT
jgi:hypothetical protein